MFLASVLSLFLVQRCAQATFPMSKSTEEERIKKGKLKIRVVYHDTVSGFQQGFHHMFRAERPGRGIVSHPYGS